MGKKRQVKKASEPSNDSATVLSGTDVHFDFTEENLSGSTKRKAKIKKKPSTRVADAEVYDNEADYPSSRVIKRAPNGDVIVESLNDEEKPRADLEGGNGIPTKLDSHWESLTSDEKKQILRIEKEEVFEVIKNYQLNNNCSCSVCGRRNVAMEQELEQIYNRLYDSAKQTNSDTDFVLFHLNMIKELQRANAAASMATNTERGSASSLELASPQYVEDMRDEAVKYCLSNKAVESLKEEVLQFKHNKQRQQQQISHQDHLERISEQHTDSHIPAQQTQDFHSLSERAQTSEQHMEEELQPQQLQERVPAPQQRAITLQKHYQPQPEKLSSVQGMNVNGKPLTSKLEEALPTAPPQNPPEVSPNDDMKNRYMDFAKAFVSSHPKIAHEYVNRMMMYPDMRALTEDLMYNNGQSFIKAMEDYVVKKERPIEEISQENSQVGSLFEDGAPLTPDQYANIQRHIAQGMTDRMNFDKGELRGVADAEGKGLFEQFLAGEDPISMLLKSFTKRNDAEQIVANQAIQEDIDYEDEDEYDEDEYSDYEDEEESEYEDDIYEDEANDNGQYQQHQYHHHHRHRHPHSQEDADEALELEEEDVSTAGNDEDYDSGIDEQERLEEGRRLIQIAITKLLQKKLVDSYHEKQAENNKLRLLQELEAEEARKREKEEKKQRKREKEKEKKRAQQQAKEQEKRKKEEEDAKLKKEAEEREMQRREAQRQRVEEAKRKKDEEKRRKLEEQRRKEEEQQRQKKLKEEQKRKREEEKRLREEEKKQKEEALKKQREVKQLGQERKKVQQSDNAVPQNGGLEEPSRRRLSTPPEAVPYGMSSIPFNNENNDDLFHMINQAASKSLSSSSAHLQTLLQPQLSQSSLQPSNNALPVTVNPSWQSVETYPNAPYDGITNTSKSLETSWNSTGGLFQGSPRRPQSHLSSQVNPLAQQSLPQYSQFNGTVGDRKKSFNNELNDLTNFLSITSLSGNQSGSAGTQNFGLSDNLWPAAEATQPTGTSYSRSSISVPPITNSSGSHRKSIWENDPLNASPGLGNLSANIWGDMTSQQSKIEPEPLADVIQKSYALLSREFSTDYVEVEKLYHTVFSFAKDNTALNYSNFLSQLLSMRTSHGCEIISNPNGTISHARIPFPYLQSQQSRAGFPLPSETLPTQNTYQGSTLPNMMLDELYNKNTSNVAQPNPQNTAGVPALGSNHFSFNPSFGQTGTKNIWG